MIIAVKELKTNVNITEKEIQQFIDETEVSESRILGIFANNSVRL